MRNFNYLIGYPSVHECAYVDPAWEPDRLLKIAKEEGFKVTKILLTHNHFLPFFMGHFRKQYSFIGD